LLEEEEEEEEDPLGRPEEKRSRWKKEGKEGRKEGSGRIKLPKIASKLQKR
jgi:hypothetical protein